MCIDPPTRSRPVGSASSSTSLCHVLLMEVSMERTGLVVWEHSHRNLALQDSDLDDQVIEMN